MVHTFTITLPTDEHGYVGRICPSCSKYFKVKPGTGLPLDLCKCPYCQYEADTHDFTTPDQSQFIESLSEKIAYERIVSPLLDNFERSLRSMGQSSRKGSFLNLNVSVNRSHPYFPIKHYRETDLETEVICDSCDLNFAIYGVFASCPDCAKINAYTIFRKSVEVGRKKLEFIHHHKEVTKDILERELKEVLSDTVSSFDALGKVLQNKYPVLVAPNRMKNLFQKLDVLDGVFESATTVKLSDTHNNFPFLLKMFQVRHAYVHNMGVVDADYIRKIPQDAHLLGRKYPLTRQEIDTFVAEMEELVKIIEGHFGA